MTKERIFYFDCFSGISGDMILGALVDLGIELKTIRKSLSALALKGYRIKSRRVERGGISSTKIDVEVAPPSKKHQHRSRSFTDIKDLIEKSELTSKIKRDSIEIFRRIGKVEAQLHRTTLNKIHFHEVGAIDSIIDIVGSALAINLLDADRIFASPINLGEGSVKCAHGRLPVPAPATLKLLQGIPCYSNGIKKELTTPTGAAVIGYFADEFCSMPSMCVLDAGYGAGGYNLEDTPNLLRVISGERSAAPKAQPMSMIETNIDDMNPEFYEHVMETLFQCGAVDVFFTPVFMKKNRPGTLLSVLVPRENADVAARILLTETSTFGVRHYEVGRTVLDRTEATIKTSHGKVRVKIGSLNGSVLRIAPEYEDCKKIASRKKIPVKEIHDEVLRLAEKCRD
jgi:hypothetical protein